MKAFMKIGFAVAFCLAGSAVYGQEPVQTLPLPASQRGNVKQAPAKQGDPQKKADKKSNTVKRTAPVTTTRQKKVVPARKEEIPAR